MFFLSCHCSLWLCSSLLFFFFSFIIVLLHHPSSFPQMFLPSLSLFLSFIFIILFLHCHCFSPCCHSFLCLSWFLSLIVMFSPSSWSPSSSFVVFLLLHRCRSSPLLLSFFSGLLLLSALLVPPFALIFSIDRFCSLSRAFPHPVDGCEGIVKNKK